MEEMATSGGRRHIEIAAGLCEDVRVGNACAGVYEKAPEIKNRIKGKQK